MKKILMIILIFGFFSCSQVKKKGDEFEQKIKKLISSEELENAGFEHINRNFVLLFVKGNFFLLNSEDQRIVKFNSQKKILKSYQEKGQGPGGMLNPFQIFLYDQDTLAVFDSMKLRLLLFNLNLKFQTEIKVHPNIRKLKKYDDGFIAFGDFEREIFARFDSNLSLIDTFLIPDRTTPFKNVFPALLYMGYLLEKGKVVHTSWMYVKEDCQADIYNLNTKEKLVTLKWKHPHPPNQKDINARKNSYGSVHISECGEFYIAHNSFAKKRKAPPQNDLYLFSKKNGEFHSKLQFNFDIIRTNGQENDLRIFFLDDEDGISYLDLDQL